MRSTNNIALDTISAAVTAIASAGTQASVQEFHLKMVERAMQHTSAISSSPVSCSDTDKPSDQKTLKVQIKVGYDNLSTQKNAEIYTGLGLDISSSSSLNESPTGSEGFSHEPLDAPEESPTSILQIILLVLAYMLEQIMKSFPVHGNLLLCPRLDDLIYMIEKEKLKGDIKPRRVIKSNQESSNGSNFARGNDKVLGGKKLKSFERNAFSVALKNHIDKGTQNGIGVSLKKETDIDTLACEELVANTLKLPLLSNSYSDVANRDKGTARAANNSMVANKVKE
ncbi:hypothetical protein HYC85_026145 [Camellia sinensis]|uniref:Uncharacterized protein n=1 Tax=Camellia sinensis TaxID=4442 RepID=A0A7J7G6S4_CAMSI|nr:hypothetical protein HYC85_026145 [Camellia sinensis]